MGGGSETGDRFCQLVMEGGKLAGVLVWCAASPSGARRICSSRRSRDSVETTGPVFVPMTARAVIWGQPTVEESVEGGAPTFTVRYGDNTLYDNPRTVLKLHEEHLECYFKADRVKMRAALQKWYLLAPPCSLCSATSTNPPRVVHRLQLRTQLPQQIRQGPRLQMEPTLEPPPWFTRCSTSIADNHKYNDEDYSSLDRYAAHLPLFAEFLASLK